MVYAPGGRTGIYEAQALLRMLLADLPLEKQLPIARRALAALPKTNWLQRNESMMYAAHLDDSEIVDRFLHVQDQAFSVSGVVDLMAAADLEVVDFVPRLLYEIDLYMPDPDICQRIKALPRMERYAATELVAGFIDRHRWLAMRSAEIPGESEVGADAVPMFLAGTGLELAAQIERNRAMEFHLGALRLALPTSAPKLLLDVVSAIDGERSLFQIWSSLPEPVTWEVFEGVFRQFAQIYEGANALVYRR